MLDIKNLHKEYRGGAKANDGISLRVAEGEVFGLLGHNGAGKTTLINQVVGLVKPTSGTISLDGRDPVADPAFARRSCSLMPQAHAPLDGVTPRQAIEMLARIRGAGKRRARDRTAELLATLDIEPWAHQPGEKLSGGVRRLTAFAMAVAEPGRVVMLDEPTNDVDPVRRRVLWDCIRDVARAGHGVLLVTHNVAEAERSVHRLAVLDEGRVVAEGTPAELRADAEGELRLELLTDDPHLAIEIPARGRPWHAERRVTVPIEASVAADAITWAQRLRHEGLIEEFSLTPVSLEDVYVRLVNGGSKHGEGNDLAALAS